MTSEIAFITINLHSKWLNSCNLLIKTLFPDSRHIGINGETDWPNVWFSWLPKLSTLDSDYIILIDEDCFIVNKDEVKKVIETMKQTNSILAGVPDAGYAQRNFNSIALNPFFLVVNRLYLRMILNANPVWPFLIFKDKYAYGVKDPILTAPNYEFFYSLFWAVLEAGGKILYLHPKDDYRLADEDNQNPATTVHLTPESPEMALHMWYTRSWDSVHISRYQKLESFLKSLIEQ